MNKYICLLVVGFLNSTAIFSQGERISKGCIIKNDRRYQIEQGILNYHVYAVNKNGKKRGEILKITIEFKDFGKDQSVSILKINENNKTEVLTDTFGTTSDELLFLNYLIPDSCSKFYKGVNFAKPSEEIINGEVCKKFLQFRFFDHLNVLNTGMVKYCNNIPVYIRGGSQSKHLIWELENP